MRSPFRRTMIPIYAAMVLGANASKNDFMNDSEKAKLKTIMRAYRNPAKKAQHGIDWERAKPGLLSINFNRKPVVWFPQRLVPEGLRAYDAMIRDPDTIKGMFETRTLLPGVCAQCNLENDGCNDEPNPECTACCGTGSNWVENEHLPDTEEQRMDLSCILAQILPLDEHHIEFDHTTKLIEMYITVRTADERFDFLKFELPPKNALRILYALTGSKGLNRCRSFNCPEFELLPRVDVIKMLEDCEFCTGVCPGCKGEQCYEFFSNSTRKFVACELCCGTGDNWTEQTIREEFPEQLREEASTQSIDSAELLREERSNSPSSVTERLRTMESRSSSPVHAPPSINLPNDLAEPMEQKEHEVAPTQQLQCSVRTPPPPYSDIQPLEDLDEDSGSCKSIELNLSPKSLEDFRNAINSAAAAEKADVEVARCHPVNPDTQAEFRCTRCESMICNGKCKFDLPNFAQDHPVDPDTHAEFLCQRCRSFICNGKCSYKLPDYEAELKRCHPVDPDKQRDVLCKRCKALWCDTRCRHALKSEIPEEVKDLITYKLQKE